MRIDIATLFTGMCDSVLGESIIGRGIKNGFIEIYTHDIRKYTENKHRRVDDKPYGGGTGMVMQAQPVYDCVSDIIAQHRSRPRIIYMSPQGPVLTQEKVRELAAEDGLILLCGHYEGIDQRVLDELGAEELSIGDYVLTGGELPALIVADAVARLQKGVLPNEDAYSIESHYNGLLEYPQYTRPDVWRGRSVPEKLLTGDHKVITEWQNSAALKVTAKKRPDMYRKYIGRRIEEFRAEFLAAKQLPDSTEINRIIKLGADDLRLVTRGKKRAISINPAGLEGKNATLPKRGKYTIITDEDGIPRCVIKTTSVKYTSFKDVTPELAAKDGGFASAEEWQSERSRIFSEEAAALGYEFSWDTTVIFEEFRLEYKSKNKEEIK